MKIIPGSYQYYEDGKRVCTYIVFGVGEHTETGERFVLAQKGGPFNPQVLIFPREEFVAGIGARYDLVLPRRPEIIPPLLPDSTQKFGRFRHFKGGESNRLGIALNPANMRELVLYQPLYGEHRYKFCLRPLAMWSEQVDKPEYNYCGPRFRLIQAYREPHIARGYQD